MDRIVEKELHLVIVWASAKQEFNHILEQLDKKFSVIRVYEVIWKEELFVENLIKFYSHSQYHLNSFKIKRMFEGKAKYCGKEPFKLIVFEDSSPLYKDRETSSGIRSVNINVFDLKQQLRAITGGGHKIHATDSIKETNKDLTLLLGLNIIDFQIENTTAWNGETEVIERNITGCGGYKSLKEFFYVLNNSINYVVLRNFEGFPNNYISKEHGDIDLLLDNLKLTVYLTGAKKIKRGNNRVHYGVKIQGEIVCFDFRFVGDNYYNLTWEKHILQERVYLDELFYVPNKDNYFYSLLYHALIHKPFLSNDYFNKLAKLGNEFGLQNELKENIIKDGLEKLKEYLKINGYSFVLPDDISVYANTNIVKYNSRILLKRRIKQTIIHFRLFLSRHLRK